MKRLKIAIALILLILSAGAGSALYTYDATQELSALLTEIRIAALEGSPEETVRLCQEYHKIWMQKEKVMVKLLRHHPIDTVTGLTSHLETLARYGETVTLLSTLDELEESIHHIWEEERPTILNIL